jgi:hypothetical protein
MKILCRAIRGIQWRCRSAINAFKAHIEKSRQISPVLDIQITLRCNARCRNCIEFCNMEDKTGLDYTDSDMTMGQIDHFIEQMKQKNRRNVFNTVYVTGGEPLLHPQIENIVGKLEELHQQSYFKDLLINSNMILSAPPGIAQYIINWHLPKDNPSCHQVALLHPTDFDDHPRTYKTCMHYRKDRVVLNYLGYSRCCAADGYIRLFGMGDLILDYLPDSINAFPKMDHLCQHCPFGSEDVLPLEKDRGCPVSDIYAREARKNQSGRKIAKRYPAK